MSSSLLSKAISRTFTPWRIEVALWVAAAAICFTLYFSFLDAARSERANVVSDYINSHPGGGPLPASLFENLSRYPSLSWLIAGTTFLLLPLLFRLIFSFLPLQLLRRRVGGVPDDDIIGTSGPVRERDEIAGSPDLELTTRSAVLLLRAFAMASQQISQKIYQRAGVYLLIGVLVAFSGLAFFYYQQGTSGIAYLRTVGDPIPEKSLQENVLHTLPRFGILFFIETIAFFFLRQYRTAMDEYRYFEAIKRRREENLVLLCLLAAPGALDLAKLPQKASLYSDVATLAQGESTELLESRKLTKDETVLLEKVVDAITQIKT